MKRRANTVRELALLGGTTPEPAKPARLPRECRRKLRLMPLRDGRVNLVDAKGALFMPCATREVAETMRAAFST